MPSATRLFTAPAVSLTATSISTPIIRGDVFASNTTQTGYAVGGGVEYKFNPAWSVKAEYQYIDLGSEKLTDSLGNATNPLDTNFQTARVGLNYRFGGRRIRASEVDRAHSGLRGGAFGRRFRFGMGGWWTRQGSNL